MRRSTIAVLILVLVPGSASACYDEHKAGWFEEMPAPSWQVPRVNAEETQQEQMVGIGIAGAGLASLALIAVSFRALARSNKRERERNDRFEPADPTPLALPFDWPIRIHEAHEPAGPNRIVREDASIPIHGTDSHCSTICLSASSSR